MCRHDCYVCKKGLTSKRELLLRKRLFRKGIDIFSKLGTLLINRNSQSADLCKQAFFLENGFFGMFVC